MACLFTGHMVPDVAIIIVNWNAGQQLRDCLESIVSSQADDFTLSRVVVVDNASSDDSLVGLDSLSLPLTIIRNPVNRGFGAACNQGAAICEARYLLFLNPDTKLFDNSLAVPLGFMNDKGNLGVGICGIQLLDEMSRITRTCASFPSLSRFIAQAIGINKIPTLRSTGIHKDGWDHTLTSKVDHVIGAFMLIRRDLFCALKGFDERFFVYLEDMDLSFRARQAGWETRYLASAQAFHAGGGTSRQIKATRLYYSLQSRLRYSFVHFPAWQAWILVFVTMLVEPWTRLLLCLLRRDSMGLVDTLRGYRMLWQSLPDLLKSGVRSSR